MSKLTERELPETQYTDNLVCPYCGHEEKDSWEIDFGPGLDGDSEPTCGSCGEEYVAQRHVSVSYSTKKHKTRIDAMDAWTQKEATGIDEG